MTFVLSQWVSLFYKHYHSTPEASLRLPPGTSILLPRMHTLPTIGSVIDCWPVSNRCVSRISHSDSSIEGLQALAPNAPQTASEDFQYNTHAVHTTLSKLVKSEGIQGFIPSGQIMVHFVIQPT